ncbi:RNA-directed DNA polymerase [Pseudonocardia sp. TMWB2A]|uniref:retron St85 family RNA-directed DNA polymerase n=1 Tax=Pseudonocardia sp. TMWB2A TaxID=687430 RepID=UPI00307DB8E1
MGSLISELSELSGMLEKDVRQIAKSAPIRYKHYTIDKRNGGKRPIAQPAREVKILQKILIAHYLSDLPIHPAATAYEKGTSIRKNADKHSPSGAILKLDFKDFFPSFRFDDWLAFSVKHDLFEDNEDRILAGNLMFHQARGSSILRLAIGAPASPRLSNLLMYDFDRLVSELVATHTVIYTRYADDLTFSANRTGYLQPVEKIVRTILQELAFPKLKLNDQKRVLATKKYRRSVTGLILTNDDRVSIGRERKKLIRSMVDHYRKGLMNDEQKKKLKGLIAFARDVEPEFVSRLETKYGKDLIEAIRHI